ncbi:MAG: adenylosuccinate synthetase [archaeon]
MVKPGKSTVLIGLMYGDEGKARVMDVILKDYGVTARFNGGANAGHSLFVNGIEIALNQVPSGIFYPDMELYIGSGCVVNPVKGMREIANIESKGLKIRDRLHISAFATLVQPHHILYDHLFSGEIGSTKNGIGPAYADQAMRAKGTEVRNTRFGDYISNPEHFRRLTQESFERMCKKYKVSEKKIKDFRLENAVELFHENVMLAKGFLSSDPLYLDRLVSSGKNVFFEGAQSVMLDVVKGMTPYVTASRTIAAAAYTGGDLSNKYHEKTIGVAKAVMSRVGNGPFVTELGGRRSEDYCGETEGMLPRYRKEVEFANHDPEKLLRSDDMFDIGMALRMMTGEYGVVSKRPRRLGMFDLVMLRQNCKLNGVDELYINKFDCLNIFAKTNLPGIPVVTAYELDGRKIDYMPSSVEEARRARPVVEYVPFIRGDISGIRQYSDLPSTVKSMVDLIENHVGTKIKGIGVGPKREQFVLIP